MLSAIPRREREQVQAELSGIWKQEAKEAALLNLKAFKAKYAQRYPEAVRSLEEDEEHLLTFYAFPAAMHRHIQSTNTIEGFFSHVRQRTDQIDAFTTEMSCLTIVWAVMQDIRFHPHSPLLTSSREAKNQLTASLSSWLEGEWFLCVDRVEFSWADGFFCRCSSFLKGTLCSHKSFFLVDQVLSSALASSLAYLPETFTHYSGWHPKNWPISQDYKSINEMLVGNFDIRKWILSGLEGGK